MRLRYVALGDSYTIGTALDDPAEAFPDQLVRALAGRGVDLELVANLGVNGYTTADLIRDELPALDRLEPEFVTLLIGANDAVQGVPPDRYEANVVTILEALLATLPADRVVAVAIPDYTVTPHGGDYGDPRQRHDAIVTHNGIVERLVEARGIRFVDTFDISLEAATDLSLVAGDGLHPSGAQYARWVDRLAPVVAALLGP
jgi:lysophospholipase L1-like esterase